ncbi:acyltransferase [Liquorilactobacillus sicerae]|uniref:acyltransferase n=1 Tax=Liquorilactobacillus sicerae TaxID=1416943 RepID=UPI00247FB4A0|nr:acyltransferase [Liquorilactobacillus sicerae]
MKEAITTKRKHRVHLYEIDFMRIFFTFGVLFNHTVNQFTNAMIHDQTYETVRSLRVMFHFTRMGFIFISGVVLTLNYYNRNDWKTFFKKRFNGSLWPYLSWNALLMLLMIAIGGSIFSLGNFGSQYLTIVMHGSSFYMYYMLLVMQLYLVFPIVVWLFKKFADKHERILLISFGCQLLIVLFIKFALPLFDKTNWPYWFKAVSVNIFAYQFYVILGTYVCLHYQATYDFLQKNIRKLGLLAFLMAIGMIFYFRIWNQQILKLDTNHALSLHQPYIACYDTVMLLVIYWIGKKYAQYRAKYGFSKWFENSANNLVKVSYGLYLTQTIGLLCVKYLLKSLQLSNLLLAILIPIGWMLVILVSFLIAWACYKIPPFGFLIGRPNVHLVTEKNFLIQKREKL